MANALEVDCKELDKVLEQLDNALLGDGLDPSAILDNSSKEDDSGDQDIDMSVLDPPFDIPLNVPHRPLLSVYEDSHPHWFV